MRQDLIEKIEMPEGIECEVEGNVVSCKSGDKENKKLFTEITSSSNTRGASNICALITVSAVTITSILLSPYPKPLNTNSCLPILSNNSYRPSRLLTVASSEFTALIAIPAAGSSVYSDGAGYRREYSLLPVVLIAHKFACSGESGKRCVGFCPSVAGRVFVALID